MNHVAKDSMIYGKKKFEEFWTSKVFGRHLGKLPRAARMLCTPPIVTIIREYEIRSFTKYNAHNNQIGSNRIVYVTACKDSDVDNFSTMLDHW